MKNPDRIDRILMLISYIWHRYPDLRLGQLLFSLAGFDTKAGISFVSDDIVENELKAVVKKSNPNADL